jgi:exodeoxyribonuclease VII large subunit
MFAAEYKRPIPKFAKRIGVVTAPTGAAIRDIMNISARRNPYVQLILYPALVQGEGAAESIVKGISVLEQQNVDVIIVGRGGGSIEDLWAFNEEIVARAIFHCNVPVISAVGHETDTTIADYVSDLRAPTPSAAAELAVFEYKAIEEYMESAKQRLQKGLLQRIHLERMKAERYGIKMKYLHPEAKLREKQQLAMEYEQRMRLAMEKKLTHTKQRFEIYIEKMKGLSPLAKLNKGFSFVASKEGNVVKRISDVKKDEILQIYVTDGMIQARVEDTIKEDYHGE